MTIVIAAHRRGAIASGSPAPSELTNKQKKEYRAFLDFYQAANFDEIIESATGHKLKLQDHGGEGNPRSDITIDFPPNDPPDILLHINGKFIGVEVTDFPPHQEPLSKVGSKIELSHPMPLFSQAGQNPKDIKQWIMPDLSSQEGDRPQDTKKCAMPDTVSPRFGSNNVEMQILANYLIKQIPQKDIPSNQILLLHGALFSTPEKEAIKLALSKVSITYLKVIVLVLQNESMPFYPAFLTNN
jgi:hypothetical protein